MDLNGMDQNGNYSDAVSLEPSAPLNSYTKGVYGDSKVLPRVGSHYQVEIPAFISELEYSSYRRDPLEDENKNGPCNFVMGLPISIIWVNQGVKPKTDRKVDFLRDLKHAYKKSRCCEHNAESFDAGSRIQNVENDELGEKTDQINGFLAPGSCGDSWSDIEKESFLLGLYIFRKNFVKVKKFVETKKMGEVLFLYHGKFYQTAEYQRWSGCRKGIRKCPLGEKLFSGLRQQEFLSRLGRGVSDELQNALIQVSKFFSDKKISLEEYIFSLKNLVGINNLVNAVGIGRGRQDLTGGDIEPYKANQTLCIRPEVPIGKTCTSLSRSEIIEYLTGDYWLSKAQSYDLFWEAVWPILVDKGWDATKTSSYNYASSSKQSHVFFAPGVPKSSSRRGLVEGEDYFGSVSDVLNLIASDPWNLGLDDGNDLTAERHCHCYLQSRTPSRCVDVMTFTVVDTSLNIGKTYELRALRDLPVEVSRNLTSISQSDEDTPEVSTDESEGAYPMTVEQDYENVKKLTRSRSEIGNFVKRKDFEAETSSDHGIGSKNAKSGNAHIAPVGKRRRSLTACSKEAFSQGMVNLTHQSSDTPVITENVHSHEGFSQVKLSAATSSSLVSSMERFEEQAQDNEPNDRPLFDLNLPAEPLDFDYNDFANEQAEPEPEPEPENVPNEQAEPMAAGEEVQVNLNSRRQSSRNRPPTARALEAIAHGFLSVNSRRGRGESSRSRSRSYQEEGRGIGIGTSDAANGTSSNISGNGEI